MFGQLDPSDPRPPRRRIPLVPLGRPAANAHLA
jgi:hypothetical protein